jgi:hypothetical protein
MTQQNEIVEPFFTNMAVAIIRRDSDAAWDSAVEKFNQPRPSPKYVH